MVGVQLMVSEARRALDTLADGKLGPADDPEVTSLKRKLSVMLQVATATEQRLQSRPPRR